MLEPKFKVPIKNQKSDHGFRFVGMVGVFKLSLLVLNLCIEKKELLTRGMYEFWLTVTLFGRFENLQRK